jgi:hypothetical protein
MILAFGTDSSIKELRRIRDQARDDRPIVAWLDRAIGLAERVAALGSRLPRIFHCASRAGTVRQQPNYADVYYGREFYGAAASLWSAIFDVDPSVADDLHAGYRYDAACAAALAGCGKGRDANPPDIAARTRLRGQALNWLTADRLAWAKLLDSGPATSRPAVVRALQNWQETRELAGLRDEAGLSALPQDEQKAWRAFWADVNVLLRKARGDHPQKGASAFDDHARMCKLECISPITLHTGVEVVLGNCRLDYGRANTSDGRSSRPSRRFHSAALSALPHEL